MRYVFIILVLLFVTTPAGAQGPPSPPKPSPSSGPLPFRPPVGVKSGLTLKGVVDAKSKLPPKGGAVGDVFYDKGAHDRYMWNGKEWQNLGPP